MKTTTIETKAIYNDIVEFQGFMANPSHDWSHTGSSSALDLDKMYRGRVIGVGQAECGPGMVTNWLLVELQEPTWIYDVEDCNATLVEA